MLPSNILLTAYGAWIISEDATRFRRKVPIRNILIRRHATFPNQKSVKYFDKRLTSEKECCSTLFFSRRPKTRDENLEIYEWKSFRSIGGGQIPLESMTRQVEYLLPTHFIYISGTFYIFIYLFIWFLSLYLYFT